MCNETKEIHPFERAGLGKAPFRYVGAAHQDLCYGEVILNRKEYEETGVRLTTKPGGTCAFCGTYIVRMYDIESADGKRFHVGCECALKTSDAKLVTAVKAAQRKVNRDARKDLAARKHVELKTLLADPDVRAALESKPHPHAGRAALGDTLLSYLEWMRDHSGNRGTAKTLKLLKAALE